VDAYLDGAVVTANGWVSIFPTEAASLNVQAVGSADWDGWVAARVEQGTTEFASQPDAALAGVNPSSPKLSDYYTPLGPCGSFFHIVIARDPVTGKQKMVKRTLEPPPNQVQPRCEQGRRVEKRASVNDLVAAPHPEKSRHEPPIHLLETRRSTGNQSPFPGLCFADRLQL
jgi:hypothetical protein